MFRLFHIVKPIFIVVVFVLSQRICHYATDGFALSKIQSNLTFHPEWETIPLDSQVEWEVRSALSQPFTYLGRGAQVYAFVSEDGRTVIKFFRHQRMHTLLCHIYFILPKCLRQRLEQTIEKRKLKIYKDFCSYKLANNTLKEETGILYLHLNKTQNLNIALTLYDKIKVRHILPLDQMEFILQKRADLLYPTLTKWIEEKNISQAKQSLSELISLLKTRCEKGLFDKHLDLRTNFGWNHWSSNSNRHRAF